MENRNGEIINTLEEGLLNCINDYKSLSSIKFNIKDVDLENNGFYVNAYKFNEKSTKKFLSNLELKKDFIKYGELMSSNDLNLVLSKLKSCSNISDVYGEFNIDDNNVKEINDILIKSKNGITLTIQDYIIFFKQALNETKIEYSLLDLNYKSDENKITFILLNNDDINPFSSINNNNLDIWKKGYKFILSDISFSYQPFFQRLSCSNGNLIKKYGKVNNIEKGSFNKESVKNEINKVIVYNKNSSSLDDLLCKAVENLSNNNISIKEMLHFKKFFESKNVNDKYEILINKYFNLASLYNAYDVDILKQSSKWLSTADTGVNGYSFFNTLTYLASHLDVSNLTYRDAVDLQIQTSNLFLKNNLDLCDVAKSNKKVEFPDNFMK